MSERRASATLSWTTGPLRAGSRPALILKLRLPTTFGPSQVCPTSTPNLYHGRSALCILVIGQHEVALFHIHLLVEVPLLRLEKCEYFLYLSFTSSGQCRDETFTISYPCLKTSCRQITPSDPINPPTFVPNANPGSLIIGFISGSPLRWLLLWRIVSKLVL